MTTRPVATLTLTGRVSGPVTVTVSRHLYKVTGSNLTVAGRQYPRVKAAVPMSLTATGLAALMGRHGLPPGQVTADERTVLDAVTNALRTAWNSPQLRAMVVAYRRDEYVATGVCRCWPARDCPDLVAAVPPNQWPGLLAVVAETGYAYCEAVRLLQSMPPAEAEVFTVLLADGMDYQSAFDAARLLA